MITHNDNGIIIGFRSEGLILCRTCFDKNRLNRFDSIIREGGPDAMYEDCDSCNIALFVWSVCQDRIKGQDGWRRIKLRRQSPPFPMLAARYAFITEEGVEEEVHVREKTLTRLIVTAAHKKHMKRTGNSAVAQIRPNSNGVALINDQKR